MQVLLVGNYGCGNLGDEALREYFLRTFPDVRFVVLSARPKKGEVPRLPFGIRSLCMRSWWRTVRALRKSSAVVFGGGSLFTDSESLRACFLWFWHALWARAFGKPILLAFQGIGPFRTRVGEWCARTVVQWSSFLSVRDIESAHRLHSWQLNKNIVQSFDPVFSCVSTQESQRGPGHVLLLIPRFNSSVRFRERACALLGERQFSAVRVLLFQSHDPRERRSAEKLRGSLPTTHVAVVHVTDLSMLVSVCKEASFVLTERYHGAIAALALGIPFEVVSQGKDDKLAALPRTADRKELRRQVQEGERALQHALEKLR